jgi:hypothetical protein
MRSKNKQDRASQERDLDETRRIGYMLLFGPDRGAEKAATFVNAVVHHQGADTADEALERTGRLLRGEETAEDIAWLRQHLDRINRALG